jgi:hypothetical protein
MAAIGGYGGGVSIGATGAPDVLLGVKKWDLEDNADLEDTTPMLRSTVPPYKTFEPLLSEWSATIEGQLDTDDAKFHGATAAAVEIYPGHDCDVVLYIDPTDDTQAYSGAGKIKKVKPSCAVDGVVTFSIEVQGTGPLTYPEALA